MKITKSLAFGILLVSCLLSGFYMQNQLGNKQDVNNFFASLNTKSQELININYPKDLIIDVSKGKISVNKKLPYCLVLDKKLNGGLVFDGSDSLNIKAFSEKPKNFTCTPFAIVGNNFIGGIKENGEIRAYQIPPEANFKIDQNLLIDGKNKYLPVIEKSGKQIYSLIPIIILLVSFPWIMLANFWYSLVVYLLAKLFKLTTHPEIGNRYWIALFFGSILSIINNILGFLSYPFISFAFSGSILIGATSIIYLKYFSNQIVDVEVIEPVVTKVVKKKK